MTGSTQKVDTKTNERLVAVETDLRALTASFNSFKEELSQGLRQVIQTQNNQVRERQWTMSGTLGVVGALAVWSGMLVAGVWFLVDMGNKPLETKVASNADIIKTHMQEDGHSKALVEGAKIVKDVQRLDGNVTEMREALKTLDNRSRQRHDVALDAVKQMDTSLQREMRDLDAVSKTRIDHLDVTLQREMRMLQSEADAKREGMRTTMEQQDKEFQRVFLERADLLGRIHDRLLDVEGNRYTKADAEATANKLMWLYGEIHSLREKSERTEREQAARRSRVNSIPDP